MEDRMKWPGLSHYTTGVQRIHNSHPETRVLALYVPPSHPFAKDPSLASPYPVIVVKPLD